MLEIDMDFAKKVAIPAVTNLQELGRVLNESRCLNSSDIKAVIASVQQRTGYDNVGVGIKTILDCVFEARAGGQQGQEVVETLADLLVEKIQDKEF